MAKALAKWRVCFGGLRSGHEATSQGMGFIAVLVGALSSCAGRLAAIRQVSPRWLFWLLVAEYIFLFLLALCVPPSDFDTMTSYIARIKFAEFGPLRQNNTLEIQYLFPTFFDFLHGPFLKWGWFTAFPNFALFTAAIVSAIFMFEARVAARWILWMAAAAPVLVTVTALKNDISLALIAFLAWAIIFYMRPSVLYPAAAFTAIAALPGTKWHGLFIAPPLFACLIWRLWRERNAVLTRRAALVFIAAFPLFWWVSSASVYLDNLRHEGELCPRPSYLRVGEPDFVRNVKAFVLVNAIETFELPLYLIDEQWMHGDLFTQIDQLTFASKGPTYLVAPNVSLAAFGLPMLLVAAGSIAGLFNRHIPGPVRVSGAIALVYLGACLKSFYFDDWTSRYYLATYVLGAAPCACLIAGRRLSKLIRWTAWSWILLVGFQSFVWNHEKPLVQRRIFYARDRIYHDNDSIWPAVFSGDRDRLSYQVWRGHLEVHKYLKGNVSLWASLAVVNRYQGNNVPFLYPLIKDRNPALTSIINDRYGQTLPEGFEDRIEWIMVFNGGFVHPLYRETFRYADVAIYRRAPNER